VNNTVFDVGIMFIMGALGFVMLKLAIPAAPFLIAFILGPLLEDNFRQSLLISKGDYGVFFSTGICWFFWILTLTSVIFLIWQHRKQKRSAAHVRAPSGDLSSPYAVNDKANDRARYACCLLAAQKPDFTIHLGDMVHPLPGMSAYKFLNR